MDCIRGVLLLDDQHGAIPRHPPVQFCVLDLLGGPCSWLRPLLLLLDRGLQSYNVSEVDLKTIHIIRRILDQHLQTFRELIFMVDFLNLALLPFILETKYSRLKYFDLSILKTVV